MHISTKGRYAVRIMLALAENPDGESVPLGEIAEKEGMPFKYLERVASYLKKEGLIKGLSYRGGGYVLTKAPEEYTIAEILYAAEGDLAPVTCLSTGAEPCERRKKCKTVKMWNDFYKLTKEYFEKIKLSDLLED